jgi:[ribosomal protein S18]-alanine N-acetyltransferase
VAAVHAIERAVFGDPWSARDFDDSVAARVPFFVALADGEIAGYVIAHYAADEGEILNLAVAPEQRRRGLGRALARRALAALAERDVREVYLEVRVSNGAAQTLYEGLGFKKVGRRAGYYRRPAEDAVVLRAAILADGGDA